MLLEYFTAEEEAFNNSPHTPTLETIETWFRKTKERYDNATGKEKASLDGAYSEAFAICGQQCLRAMSKLETSSMAAIRGLPTVPHWAFIVSPMGFSSPPLSESEAAVIYRQLEQSGLLKRIESTKLPGTVTAHICRPDKECRDRASDVRVAALELGDEAEEIADLLSQLVTSSGGQKSLSTAASIKRRLPIVLMARGR